MTRKPAATFLKICSHHGLTEFYQSTRTCVTCQKRNSRNWTIQHPERHVEFVRAWEKNNPEKAAQARKNKGYQRRYYYANREKIIARNKGYQTRYYYANREKIIARNKARRAKNKREKALLKAFKLLMELVEQMDTTVKKQKQKGKRPCPINRLNGCIGSFQSWKEKISPLSKPTLITNYTIARMPISTQPKSWHVLLPIATLRLVSGSLPNSSGAAL